VPARTVTTAEGHWPVVTPIQWAPLSAEASAQVHAVYEHWQTKVSREGNSSASVFSVSHGDKLMAAVWRDLAEHRRVLDCVQFCGRDGGLARVTARSLSAHGDDEGCLELCQINYLYSTEYPWMWDFHPTAAPTPWNMHARVQHFYKHYDPEELKDQHAFAKILENVCVCLWEGGWGSKYCGRDPRGLSTLSLRM